MTAELALAERAARAAGALQHSRPHQVDHKGAVDLVSEIDLASEATIRELLLRERPDVPVLAEEGGGAEDAATRWIVDPLDGTTNFVHAFPFSCVSIALQVEGTLEAACVFQPSAGRCWTAARGHGARLDGEVLRVSRTPVLDRALVASGFAYDRREHADRYLRFVRAFLQQAQGFRRCGSAALDLCMVATGWLDGYWEFGLSPWDVAAGALIVQEAGGTVSDMALGPLQVDQPRILASNGHIHAEMGRVIGGLLPF